MVIAIKPKECFGINSLSISWIGRLLLEVGAYHVKLR